ncbi:MAG: hypothetical protein JZD41_05375, partial [Thermoproteus sp.]|nr:hypothetical protein [Thermoproteus sp.]
MLFKGEQAVEDAFILASALEKQMRAMFGESAEEIGEGIWREVYRLDEKLSDRAFEVLREKIWELHTIDEGAREAKNLPQYKEYIERLEKIADLLKAAAKELVEEAEREGKGDIKWIKGRPYIAYEGPVKLSAQVEHVTRGDRTYALVAVGDEEAVKEIVGLWKEGANEEKLEQVAKKYGDKVAWVVLEVEELKRSALSHNLAAIATDDARDFYTGRILHITTNPVQAAERLLMWALFMPGEYKITVRYVYATEEGLSPSIEMESRFSRGGIEKIEGKSPIHGLVLRLAKELAGREKLKRDDTDKILAASWLMISAILNTPDGGRPSEGLAILVEKVALPRAAFDRLRPILEELDALLGPVSREDKAYLVGKMVDYDGYIKEGFLRVRAEKIKGMPIELDGVEIRMADVAEAAAKAFWMEGGWSGNELYFGPAREALEFKVDEEAPLKAPAFKAIAALIVQKTWEEADELRRKDLVEYGEPIKYKIGGVEVEITPAKAKEGEQTPIARKNLEEVWRGFEAGKYTHLRLAVGGEVYDLVDIGRDAAKFQIRGEGAQKLEKALKGLGLDVKRTPGGYLYLDYEHLKALLDKGVEAEAVRRAKRGEAQWRLEITYGGVTIVLEMTYDER